jgi:hypothetical protein
MTQLVKTPQSSVRVAAIPPDSQSGDHGFESRTEYHALVGYGLGPDSFKVQDRVRVPAGVPVSPL